MASWCVGETGYRNIAILGMLAGVGCESLWSAERNDDFGPPPPREVAFFLKKARWLGTRLWTNTAFHVSKDLEYESPTEWIDSEEFIQRFSVSEWRADSLTNQDAYWRKQGIIIFSSPMTNMGEFCHFAFLRDSPQTVTWIQNKLYMYPNVPFRPDNRPLHTTAQQVRQKALAYAALLGISNILDETRFVANRPLSCENGEWRLYLQAVRNGFPTPCGVSMQMADLPGLPLGEWNNEVDKIPERLPTKLMIAAENAAKIAREYLDRYCAEQGMASNADFVTNSVQYVVSQMNFIKKNECRLAWVNTFQIPQHEKARLNNSIPIEICVCGAPKSWRIADYLTITITLDAATGEFLKGDHWD